MKQKGMSRFTIFYIVSAIIVALLFIASFTFAWYVKSTSHTIGVVFSRPIVLMLDPEIKQTRGEVEVNDGNDLLPGSKVSVNLGFRMADINNTAPAYIRAKLVLKFDNIYDGNTGDPIVWNSSKYITIDMGAVLDNPAYTWEEVNFSKSGKDEGKWWVLKYQDGVSLQAQPGQSYKFMEGEIELSKKITNDFAEKQIHLLFTVDAIQIENIDDPLINPTNSVWAED